MDSTRDDGPMDCTEPTSTAPQADALGPEIGTMDVCATAEHPKEMERGEGSTDEECPPTGVSEQTTVQPQDKNARYERNLKKFLENGKTSLEIRSRRERKLSEREIKSDGVVKTRVDYQGNVSKITSILSEVRLMRWSAPSTYEPASNENPETKEIEVTGHQSTTMESVEIPPGNLETPVSFRTSEIAGPANAVSDNKTPLRDFKAPVPPPACSTPGQASTPNPPFCSPGTSMVREGQSTPVFRRPTDFVLKPRKSYYMFSPEDSGILRQCQSMPEINRRQRKEKHQRRSLVLEDRLRIVRSLFRDPPGPATPETRLSMVPKSHIPRPSEEAAVAKEAKGRSSLGNVKSNTCRKLTFTPPPSKVSAAPMEENTEDSKRKETSPLSAECPTTSVKKVRISPKPEKTEDAGSGSHSRGQKSNVPGEISDVPREREASPGKRKSGESSSSKKK